MNKVYFAKLICFFILSCVYSAFSNAITINTDSIFQSNLQPQLKIPSYYKIYPVNTAKEVYLALKSINKKNGYSAILFSEGIYNINRTLKITAPNVMLLSKSGSPFKTILRGKGMKASKGVDNLIRVSGTNFILDGLTLEQSGNHLIQIAGENGAKSPIIRNAILQDAFEQLIKVTYSRKDRAKFSNNGLVENCLFRYTKGIGPYYYIGGIDAHGIKNWLITNNVFENIASPGKHISEHAIHLWNDTAHNIVENNLIVNSDRGIGFGMRQRKTGHVNYSNLAGVIQGNIIYHADNNHPFADTGIILEESPETLIKNNFIYFEHEYPSAIEFRFTKTTDVLITGNITNKGIMLRDNAQALIIGNEITTLTEERLLSALKRR